MLRIFALRCAALVAGAVLGVPIPIRAQTPEPYPLGAGLPAFVAPAQAGAAPRAEPDEPTGVLQLREALALALLRNAALAADSYELRAREAALLQAGALPNPTLSLEVEDVAGSGDFSGVDQAQTTLLLGQLIELGGKRAARIEVAAAERDLAAWDYEVRRIDVFAGTTAAFVDVLAAQERLRLADEALELARSVQQVASLRKRAGLASPAEEIRAGVATDVAGVEREHTEHELETARQELAAFWSGEAPRFERAEGALEVLPQPPSPDEIEARLAASPSLALWQAELARRHARRAGAQSQRIPDLTVFAGPRRLSGPEDTALVAGVSLPLPLWNRNRGAIEESEHRVSKLAAEQRSARVLVATDLATARVALVAAVEESHLLRTRVLPGIQNAVDVMRRGYEQGRFAQIEVLDAERARVAAREQYLRALVEAHRSASEIERLTGAPLEVRP
jgi:cobalt-zinc-cadmium efflux system outer membrane protein